MNSVSYILTSSFLLLDGDFLGNRKGIDTLVEGHRSKTYQKHYFCSAKNLRKQVDSAGLTKFLMICTETCFLVNRKV